MNLLWRAATEVDGLSTVFCTAGEFALTTAGDFFGGGAVCLAGSGVGDFFTC